MAGQSSSTFNCVYLPIIPMTANPSTSIWTIPTAMVTRPNPMTVFGGHSSSPYGVHQIRNENRSGGRDHHSLILDNFQPQTQQQNFYLPAGSQTTHYRVQCNRLFKVTMLASPAYLSGYYTVSREIGRYVYFPCEKKYFLVNYGAVEEYEYHEMAVAQNGFVQIVEKRVVRQPRIIINYCSHRSHTPSDRFDRVVKREPVREEWPKLTSILKDLQKRTTLSIDSCDDEIEDTHPTTSSRAIMMDSLARINRNSWPDNGDYSNKFSLDAVDRLSNKSKKRRYPEVITVENDKLPLNGNKLTHATTRSQKNPP